MDVLYHPRVKADDIPRLGKDVARRVREVIERKLAVDPFRFGLPLRRGLHGYRKLRVGDHRVIYRVEGAVVKVIIIGHRKDVYDNVRGRLGNGD